MTGRVEVADRSATATRLGIPAIRTRPMAMVIVAAACLSLLISSFVVAHKRPLWNDEMLSLVLLHDSSFTRMMNSWGDTFNQAPPLYFMLGWIWDKLAGSSDVSLRLFGSAFLCLALVLTWLALRRAWGDLPAALGTVGTFCVSSLILYHNAEARMYGLFAATCAAGVLVYVKMACSERVAGRLLLANVLVHAAIVLTHLYGVLYSGALLASLILVDRLCHRPFRLRIYGTFVAGWLFIAPFVPGLMNQSNNEARWFQRVSLEELGGYLLISFDLRGYLAALILFFAMMYLAGLVLMRLQAGSEPERIERAQIATLLAGFGFLLVPLFAWLVTITVKPMLSERYLIPTIALSWPVAISFLVARLAFKEAELDGDPQRDAGSRFLPWITVAALALPALIYPIRYARHYPSSPRPGHLDVTYGHADLPIAMEAGHDFLPRIRYAANPQRYFHIRDWDVAIRNTASPFATGDHTHLLAVSRHYPSVQSVEGSRFLKEHQRFLVWNEPDQKWFEWRVQADPSYRVTWLAKEDGSTGPIELYLVEKRGD